MVFWCASLPARPFGFGPELVEMVEGVEAYPNSRIEDPNVVHAPALSREFSNTAFDAAGLFINSGLGVSEVTKDVIAPTKVIAEIAAA